jgi:signal peptidase I
MQCNNCRFENMPGVLACGRCGAALQLATLAIDVYPPRANRWTKIRRRWWPFNINNLRRFLAAAVDGLSTREAPEGDPGPVLWRSIIPGLPQVYQRREVRGWCFLLAYLGCGTVGMAVLGTRTGSMLLGMAGAIHAASVIDVVLPATRRLLYTLACCLAITGVIYLPVVWVVGGFASPRVVLGDSGPFQRNDVVLVRRWNYANGRPRPGDVALYTIPPTRVQINAPDGPRGGQLYQFEGERMDRIVAGPGEHVVLNQSTLLVNGSDAVHLPLNRVQWPSTVDLHVPDGQYLIVPSADRVNWGAASEVNWRKIVLVSEDRLLGKIYLRHHPLSRFSWVR